MHYNVNQISLMQKFSPALARMMVGRRTICFAIAALIGAVSAHAQPAATGASAKSALAPFQVGVIPNVSARVIAANYAPMRAYLERTLERPVEISTAPDFPQFFGRAVAGEFDLFIIAPNLGRLLQVDGKASALAIYEPTIPCLLVSLVKNAPPVSALRGKKLALSNPQSLVAMRGLQWLKSQGLNVNTDFTVVHARNDDSLGSLLTTGEAPLAMMSMGEYRAIGEATRAQLQIVTIFDQVPGFFVMAKAGLSEDAREKLKKGMLNFLATAEGKQFSAQAGIKHIRDITAEDLAALDPHVEATRAFMSPRK